MTSPFVIKMEPSFTEQNLAMQSATGPHDSSNVYYVPMGQILSGHSPCPASSTPTSHIPSGHMRTISKSHAQFPAHDSRIQGPHLHAAVMPPFQQSTVHLPNNQEQPLSHTHSNRFFDASSLSPCMAHLQLREHSPVVPPRSHICGPNALGSPCSIFQSLGSPSKSGWDVLHGKATTQEKQSATGYGAFGSQSILQSGAERHAVAFENKIPRLEAFPLSHMYCGSNKSIGGIVSCGVLDDSNYNTMDTNSAHLQGHGMASTLLGSGRERLN